MPFRSKETLETWVDEFRQQGHPVPGELEVLTHDGGAGEDTGLIVMRFKNTSTEFYLQPVGPFRPEWEVIFEPREAYNRASRDQMIGLAEEVATASALLAYLEERSRGPIEARAADAAAIPGAAASERSA